MSYSCCLCPVLSVVITIISMVGWIYWGYIVSIYWNFVSWLMLAGPLFLIPGYLINRYEPKSEERDAQLKRRVIAAGCLFFLICAVLFTNVPALPEQLHRHLNAYETIITPNHALVTKLQETFFERINPDIFNLMSFDEKMLAVDIFIRDVITWKPDYDTYQLVGLLLTPEEVIQNMAGDCQGQAAVTTSLLLSMGFNAWVVETPFHWWTHAQDPKTGQYTNLNVHGHAGDQGNVIPQPIDLVYTHPKPACVNCSSSFSDNKNSILYMAPPHRAFAIAFTGAHIFVRSGLTLNTISLIQIVTMGLVAGLLATLYGTYVQYDFNVTQFMKRLVISSVIGIGPVIYGMCFWATYLYPVSILHTLFMVGFLFFVASSDI